MASEGNPLVERVDALLRRHKSAEGGGDDLPVLTEIVEPGAAVRDVAAVQELARELERAVLARLEGELETALADLGGALRRALRESVAGAVARELESRRLDAGALAAKRAATPPKG
ncbi:MAG: hypothetical protein AB7S87_10930 [Burkholderiales bacterium]